MRAPAGRLSRDEEFHRFAAARLPTLLRGAYLLLRDIDLAEDAVQGTLLRVFRHWERARYQPELYAEKALLSVCRDYWRRQRRRPREVVGLNGVGVEETDVATRVAERDALDRALAELPDVQREVLVLRFFFDLSVGQTALLLEVPEGTVKSAAYRGLRQLRDAMAGPATGGDDR